MLGAPARFVVLAMLVAGCGGAAEGTSSKPETKATPTPEAPNPTTTPEAPKPTLPSAPYVPTRPLPELVVTTPAPACPELPALPADASEDRKALHLRALAVRRLACEPALFAKTTDELRTELGLSPDDELDFSGLRGVRLRLPGEPTVADVAAVFGIASPQVHVKWQAYHPMTNLGTNPTTGAFDLWGPGTVNVGVQHEVDRYGDDAGKEKVLPVPPDRRVGGWVIVGMPEAVVTIEPDPDAVPMVVTALGLLAAKPELLSGTPKEVAPQVGLAGERFRVAETSSHSGDSVTRGISIDPRRTTLPAAELARALGLADAKARSVNREHDVWNVEAGGSTEIPWNGLELEITLSSPEGDADGQGLEGLEVTFVSAMPLVKGA